MIRYAAMVFETLDIKGSGPQEMAKKKKKGKWFLRLPQFTSFLFSYGEKKNTSLTRKL